MSKKIPLVVNENSPIHDIVSEYNHENKLSCIDYIEHVLQCKLCMEAIEMFLTHRERAISKIMKGKRPRK